MKNLKILLTGLIIFIFSLPAFCSSNKIEIISGNAQTGIRGYPLKEDFVVRLYDEKTNSPLINTKVNFSILTTVNNKEAAVLSVSEINTDNRGYANVRLSLAKDSPDEVLVVANSEVPSNSVVLKTKAFNKNWLLMMIINLCGGLALLLFGMTFINNALQKAAGEKFRNILTSVTSSKIKGATSGFLMTAFNQSSSATVLLTISLVGAGIISFNQSMAISLGASLGSTITAQLVAFRLIDYALPIIAAGYLISFVSGGKRVSKIGDAIFGFGILFFGMKLMTDAMVPVTLNPTFLDFLSHIQSPILGIFTGFVITLIVQSSGAVVGMIIVLATTNVLTLNQGICLALGSQVGTCITVVLGSLKMPRNAKRTMLWQIVQQVLAVLLILPFLGLVAYKGEGVWYVFVRWFTSTFFFTDDVGRQIAMSHTLAAFVNLIILLPLLTYMQKFIFLIYPFKNTEVAFGTVYIDIKNMEKNTDKALDLSKKEISRLSEFVLDVLKNSIKALKTKNINIAESISNKTLKIDLLSKEIIPYIAKVGQKKLTEEQSKREIRLLYILSDLDEISDIIDRNLMHIAKKKISSFSRFSKEGLEDIQKIHTRICENLEKVLNAFNSDDKVLAKEVADSKSLVQALESELRQKHIARLHANLQESIETSGLHMDVLDQYARINSLISDIGRIIAE